MKVDAVKTILVVGAGTMGHGIAQTCALKGFQVDLVDRDESILANAVGLMRASLETLAANNVINSNEIEPAVNRVSLSTDISKVAGEADFVIESVSEDTEIKRKVFAELGKACRPEVILSTNTSSLDVFSLAEVPNPDRLVAAHWFAPPQIIPLVEVCPGPDTSPEVVEQTVKLMRMLGKEPVTMDKFVPSFIVNRIQGYISMAVFEMLNNGWATPDQIDRAVKLSLGVRLPVVGVVQSMDFTGLDLIQAVYGAQGINIPLVDEKVTEGKLGAKTSSGIYEYDGKPEKEILAKRDGRYLKTLEHLKKIKAFEPI